MNDPLDVLTCESEGLFNQPIMEDKTRFENPTMSLANHSLA